MGRGCHWWSSGEFLPGHCPARKELPAPLEKKLPLMTDQCVGTKAWPCLNSNISEGTFQPQSCWERIKWDLCCNCTAGQFFLLPHWASLHLLHCSCEPFPLNRLHANISVYFHGTPSAMSIPEPVTGVSETNQGPSSKLELDQSPRHPMAAPLWGRVRMDLEGKPHCLLHSIDAEWCKRHMNYDITVQLVPCKCWERKNAAPNTWK